MLSRSTSMLQWQARCGLSFVAEKCGPLWKEQPEFELMCAVYTHRYLFLNNKRKFKVARFVSVLSINKRMNITNNIYIYNITK